MGDEEDEETLFNEIDARQLAAKTAWVKFFISEASNRGYTREDIIALLDEPGMTGGSCSRGNSVRQTAESSAKTKLGRREGLGERGVLSGLASVFDWI